MDFANPFNEIAGKGQSVINPTIDVWLRSDEQSNIVCNDPKGELYLSFTMSRGSVSIG